jgi:hypothetical protein
MGTEIVRYVVSEAVAEITLDSLARRRRIARKGLTLSSRSVRPDIPGVDG